ncbi:TBC1 domain family member 23 [Brachionus plicatilis]|uniref:TBC1 domain family member 23 n=1 Tax=Brachionus plicatilis TaxID=10195 RepID=A0A3M7RVJ0_BRAPC|nr:TBC1 domain family member 23 [Brachionus plicatilis]
MSESDEEFNEESLWETELEIALLSNCDYGTIRNISKLRPLPDNLRNKVWKVCLDVEKDIEINQISKWKEIYDLPQQDKIREDCQHLAQKLHPDDEEQQLIATSAAEAIVTFFCISNDEFYEKDNGWLEILFPILSLNLNKNEAYNFFSAIIRRYIPKDCVQNGSPYHLFRLLMLYHDPELCAFLDTKKISPDSYAHIWFRSLFAANSNLKVILNLWDMYFQLGDQFLIFFMSLILVFNLRDEIMASTDMEKAELAKMILSSPLSLNEDDLNDFNTLCQHFATKTPQSFRKIFQKIVKEFNVVEI